MCLYTKNRNAFVAEEDIVCYKILIKTKIPFVYKTPIVGTKLIKFPNIKTTFKAKGNHIIHLAPIHPTLSGNDIYEVAGGFIHTYKNLEGVKSLLERNCFENFTVFKCIIPKGTNYYKSVNELEDEYASEKIKILEEIEINFFEDLVIYVD